MKSLRVAIIGATGLVGRTMLRTMEERGFPIDELIAVASERSVGKKIPFHSGTVQIVGLEDALASKPDIALFSAGGDTSLEWAPKFAAVGTTVVDNSSAWRMHKDYKLIVPEVNGDSISKDDLIISNPPFYTDHFKSRNEARNKARFEDALPFEELLTSVSKLLSVTGQLNVIIPFSEEINFISLAKNVDLYPIRILRVRGQEESPVKRSLISFTFQENKIEVSELTIEITRHHYTHDHINLTKDFYLKL